MDDPFWDYPPPLTPEQHRREMRSIKRLTLWIFGGVLLIAAYAIGGGFGWW